MARPPAAARTAVLIPVKAFAAAKGRLAEALGEAERADLARSMATAVVAAAGDLPVTIVCDDDEVEAWARAAGCSVVWSPGRGLNGAVRDGVDELAADGYGRAVVAHADLPHARDLTWLAERGDGVVLVPDRRDDGTNVVSLPTGSGFGFSYGPRSFDRHVAEARRLGLPLRVARDERLGWDVDSPDDLAAPLFAD